MFVRLSQNNLFRKIVGILILLQFSAGFAVIRGYAAPGNLRPAAVKQDGSRSGTIQNSLDAASLDKVIKTPVIHKDGGITGQDVFKNILGEYRVSSTINNLAFGTFVQGQIDLSSVQNREALVNNFGEIKSKDRFFTLEYAGIPLALVKKAETGEITVKKVVEDIASIPLNILSDNAEKLKTEGVTSSDILVRDFLILEKRSRIDITQCMTVEFGELRDYVYNLAKNVGQEKALEMASAFAGKATVDEAMAEVGEKAKQLGRDQAKDTGLALAGGKGLSLSVMSRVVDVPPGLNVTTTAYFKFVKDNKQVWEKIFNELQTLDTMDDQKRDVVTSEIRDVIKSAPIPEDIKAEVTAMYHQLSVIRFLAGKPSPAPVAVRSSGTKEDIHVKTWLPVSTGSQAGQSDTFLNVKGERDVLDKLRADWASLFTDRAVSYRDDATFLQFSGAIDFNGKTSQDVYWGIVAKLREYSKKLDKPEYNVYADLMSKVTSPNPGSVSLMNAMEEILRQESNPEMSNALAVLKKKAEEVVHPEQIGIDVVIMQMAKSYLAGVLFTVNPATKMAGVAQSLYKSWYMGDDSLVYRDAKTDIIQGTRPIVVSFDVAFGYGENVVGGKVNPDKFIMGTYDGESWFVIEKSKGNKLIQMKDVEEVIDLLKDKISEKGQRQLAMTVKDAIAYDEVGKRINGIMATKLYGIKYLKALEGKEESDKDKKARVQAIANEIADMVKNKVSEDEVVAFIKGNFEVVNRKGYKGIQEMALSGVVREVFEKVQQAQAETDRGMFKLSKQLGDMGKADTLIHMIKEVWENKEFTLSDRQAILDKLNLTNQELRNMSYLIRALVDNSFTSNYETTLTHQDTFTMTDDQAQYVARMGWAITEYYKDARDIEYAIEIDKTASSDKAVRLYVVDDLGNVQGMDNNGNLVTVKSEKDKARIKEAKLRLYNVQARPYTAEYLKVDVMRARTEADEKWLEENSPKAIASGTKGENATQGYVLVFDPNKDVAWHADQIRRLKAGDFTAEEKAQIMAMGFNPEEYGSGKEKQLSVILYLLEADPNHDPIMRLVDSVVTIRGGDTCHAAIFCREQGIPAVTGAGKVILNGQLLKTGDAVTVDANNGNIYEMPADAGARIPINYVKFKIKPYGIPGDDDNMPYPGIGQIIAAASAAQQNSPIMLAVDAVGNSLTRAEFKGEEIGINVYAGYGHYLLQQIKAGKIKEPVRVRVQELIQGKVPGAKRFVDNIENVMAGAFAKDPAARSAYRDIMGKDFNKADSLQLLEFFDLKSDIELYGLDALKLVKQQVDILDLVPRLPENMYQTLEYLYGATQRRLNYDYNIIADLQNHPWILKEVDSKLAEKGYATFKEYITNEFLYFYNLMGFTIAPDQTAKNRAYDFAQDKIRGMPGSEVFSWPGVNPLVGLRGTSLEIEAFDEDFGGNQLVLDFLFDSVIQAHQNTGNQAWFYVFVRSSRELETLDKIIEHKAKQTGKLPKEIGIMIEVPSAALVADELAVKMSEMEKKYKKYGVEHTFFSFGTNDYSHLAGMGDREDPRMKLKIMDPAAIEAIGEMKAAGYYYDDAAKVLPLIDEGADVMQQLMETVVAAANGSSVATSLCGEAITALVNRGDYETAGKIMALLDSFGVSMMKVRLAASMTRVDTMAATKGITIPEAGRSILFDLSAGEVKQKKGVIKGEIIFVDNADDLVPNVLKGLQGPELTKKKEMFKLQSLENARSTMRTFNKIVIITKNLVAQQEPELVAEMGKAAFSKFVNYGLLKDIGNGQYVWTNLGVKTEKFNQELTIQGFSEKERKAIEGLWQKAWDNSIEGLERRGIDWDDLQYAKAIIVDADVNLDGWDVFRKDKSIIPTRIKATVKGISSRRAELEGQLATIDYAAKKVYKDFLSVEKIAAVLRSLPIPAEKPMITTQSAVAENANSVYQKIGYHPKLLLAYERNAVNELGKIFEEYVGKLVEEVEKVTQETDVQKRVWLLQKLQNKVGGLAEPMIKSFMSDVLSEAMRTGAVTLPDNWNKKLWEAYRSDLESEISKILNGKTVEQYFIAQFSEQMKEVLSANKGALVVHLLGSLNCVDFFNMKGGFLVEQVNPNPDYGILGAARAIGDMWEINRMELSAFKAVWDNLPVDQRGNFGLQITNLKGTQSGAVVIGWRNILKQTGIIPGQDGLQVGVNIVTPADSIAADKYFEYFNTLGSGLSFISYDALKLGAAWAGVDIFWKEWRRLAKEDELLRFGVMTGWMAEAKALRFGGKVLSFDISDEAKQTDGGAEVVPYRVVVENLFRGIIKKYDALDNGQALSLEKEELEAILWILNSSPFENMSSPFAAIKSMKNIRNVIERLSDDQKKALSVLSQGLVFVNHGLDKKVAALLVDKKLLDIAYESDTAVYKGLNSGFDSFANALKEVKNAEGALVVSANAVLNNAGTLRVLREIKETGLTLEIIVRADTEDQVNKLIALRADEVATIQAKRLSVVLSGLKNAGITDGKIVVIKGKEEVKDAVEAGVKVVEISMPKTEESSINSMALVAAKAVTIVLKGEETVAAQYREMAVKYAADNSVTSEELDDLQDLTSQISEIPMAKVSEEVAKAQATYEETISKI
ncbi:MAG: PEP/pyruvate-binding domain-containing protein [Candidatus Omnitrophica bacterium]|nr:PEP/pyruvate-binding domain-containing protein [Candidatus Omnitrophota bacterium]